MLTPSVIEAIARLAQRAEQALIQRIGEGRVRQEPDMTSRLAQSIETLSEEIDGVRVELNVVDGLGPGAAERQIGADLVGILRVRVGDVRVTKGFLAQAKRAGTQGLHYAAAEEETENYSHWLYRGDLHLQPSGIVSVTKPSPDLEEQCENMLRITADSFVLVYDATQVGVVSASAVRALRGKPRNARSKTPLGTKRLDDFFVHLADSFIGDPSLTAADPVSVAALAAARGATTGLMLTVETATRGQTV